MTTDAAASMSSFSSTLIARRGKATACSRLNNQTAIEKWPRKAATSQCKFEPAGAMAAYAFPPCDQSMIVSSVSSSCRSLKGLITRAAGMQPGLAGLDHRVAGVPAELLRQNQRHRLHHRLQPHHQVEAAHVGQLDAGNDRVVIQVAQAVAEERFGLAAALRRFDDAVVRLKQGVGGASESSRRHRPPARACP